MVFNYKFSIITIIFFFSFLNNLFSNTPDAGSITSNLENTKTSSTLSFTNNLKDPTEVSEDQTKNEDTNKNTITVSEFIFNGNTVYSSDLLNSQLKDFLNKPIGFVQLRAATIAINDFYRQQGWLVKSYMPQQEIINGRVLIEIVESTLGNVNILSDETNLVSGDLVNSYILNQQEQGDLLNLDRIDRAIYLIDSLAGVNVVSDFTEGGSIGQTDLNVKLTNEKKFFYDITANNFGSRSTGSEQLIFNGTINSPSNIGDKLNLNAIKSEGMNFGTIQYSAPIGLDGHRGIVQASSMDYQVISEDFSSLNLEGNSQTLLLGIDYPLHRSNNSNIDFNSSFERKWFSNLSDGSTSSNYEVERFTVSLSSIIFDGWHGGGANSINVTYSPGKVKLGTIDSSENSELSGSFNKIEYQISRQQYVTETLSLYGLYQGQLTKDNLDSSEKFYLGGANGVRAYPSSEGGGSLGQSLSLELRYKLPKNQTLTAFYDWGQVKQNADNNIASPASPNQFHLEGAGVSYKWKINEWLDLGLTYAHRIGNNPNPTSAGKDQDGSLDKHRFWLETIMAF